MCKVFLIIILKQKLISSNEQNDLSSYIDMLQMKCDSFQTAFQIGSQSHLPGTEWLVFDKATFFVKRKCQPNPNLCCYSQATGMFFPLTLYNVPACLMGLSQMCQECVIHVPGPSSLTWASRGKAAWPRNVD